MILLDTNVVSKTQHREGDIRVKERVSELWGELRAQYRRRGQILAAPDGLIAATALHHDLTLWTRNTGDFAETGVRLFNPWED